MRGGSEIQPDGEKSAGGLAGRQVGRALHVRSRRFPLGREPRSSHRTRPGWLGAPFVETRRTPQGGARPSALVRSLHLHAADWNSKSERSCEVGWGGERSEILARRGRFRDCVCDRLPASLRSRLRLPELPHLCKVLSAATCKSAPRRQGTTPPIYWPNLRARSVWRLFAGRGARRGLCLFLLAANNSQAEVIIPLGEGTLSILQCPPLWGHKHDNSLPFYRRKARRGYTIFPGRHSQEVPGVDVWAVT